MASRLGHHPCTWHCVLLSCGPGASGSQGLGWSLTGQVRSTGRSGTCSPNRWGACLRAESPGASEARLLWGSRRARDRRGHPLARLANFTGNLWPPRQWGSLPSGPCAPHPASPTPSSVVSQVPVDGPEAETEAEEPPGSLHQVRRPGFRPADRPTSSCRLGPPEGLPRPGRCSVTSDQPCPVQAPWLGGHDVCHAEGPRCCLRVDVALLQMGKLRLAGGPLGRKWQSQDSRAEPSRPCPHQGG